MSDSPAHDNQTTAATPRLPLPPWDMYTVSVALFSAYILIPLIVSSVQRLALPFLPPEQEILVQQISTLLSWGLIFSVIAWRYRGNLWAYLGLTPGRPLGYYAWESFLLLLSLLTVLVVMSLWTRLTGAVPDNAYQNYSAREIRIISVLAVLMAPVLEEVVFRGFVQGTFHKISTPLRSVIFTGLLFLLFHPQYFANGQAFTYVLTLGLVLGVWRERTQSIIPGILAHTVNNLLASLQMLIH